MEFKPWTQDMPDFEYDKKKSYFELVVPTKDTQRFKQLLRLHLLNKNPVFFTGMTGVGKSIIITQTLKEMAQKDNYDAIFLSFSSQTQSKETQAQIEEKLQKQKRTVLAAPPGRKIALFIDDVNMPSYDDYGSQMPIELLRQFLDYRSIYDRDGLF